MISHQCLTISCDWFSNCISYFAKNARLRSIKDFRFLRNRSELNYRCKITPFIYRQKIPGTRKPKIITFLRCVKRHDAMEHNKIDTPHLVWTVTSEQMKIILTKFLLLRTWCHSFMWLETQLTVKNLVFIILQCLIFF